MAGGTSEVLRDSEKRAAYDQLGRDYRPGQQFRPPPDWGQRFGQSGSQRFSDLNGFSDFFSSLFGGAAEAGPPPDADAGHLDITVEEAFAGSKRRVTLNEAGRTRSVDVQIPAGASDGEVVAHFCAGGLNSAAFPRPACVRHLSGPAAGKDVQIELLPGPLGGTLVLGRGWPCPRSAGPSN